MCDHTTFLPFLFLYRKNFHLLKKNSKLLRELKNLDSRQWYVKVYQTTLFLSVFVGVRDAGYGCRSDTPAETWQLVAFAQAIPLVVLL